MYNIGAAAYSGEPSRRLLANADGFVEGLRRYRDRVRLFLGGYWGLMKYIADKAASAGFTVVFTLPAEPPVLPPRRREFVPVVTDEWYVARSTAMCRSVDVLVVMGGGIGSMIEALMAYDYGKPVIIVESGMATDKLRLLGEYFDERRKARVYYVGGGGEAASLAARLLGLD